MRHPLAAHGAGGDRLNVALLPSPEGAEEYLAVDKPAGVAVHGPGGLLAPLRERFGEGLALVHRLDRATSGVLLLARTPGALRAAHAAWPDDVTKTYLARSRGVPEPREGSVNAPLLEHRSGKPQLLRRALAAKYGPAIAGQLALGRRVRDIPLPPPPGRTAVHPAGRAAVTRYRVLEAADGNALVELTPEQGRMHQIRVHLRHLGTPLLFDPLYDEARREGDPAPFLHALRIVWKNPPGRPEGTVWSWERPHMIGA